jgi:hypothetical protein
MVFEGGHNSNTDHNDAASTRTFFFRNCLFSFTVRWGRPLREVYVLKTVHKPKISYTQNYSWKYLKSSINYILLYTPCNIYMQCICMQVKSTIICNYIKHWEREREREREEWKSEKSKTVNIWVVRTGCRSKRRQDRLVWRRASRGR